jgi:hypothetical protein
MSNVQDKSEKPIGLSAEIPDPMAASGQGMM